MKKLKFLSIAVIAVLCTACPDDPDPKITEKIETNGQEGDYSGNEDKGDDSDESNEDNNGEDDSNDDSNGSVEDEKTGEEILKENIIGKWYRSVRNCYYYFLEDGNGYTERFDNYDGIYRRAFEWDIIGNTMYFEWLKDDFYNASEVQCPVSFDADGNLVFGTDETYERKSSVGTTTVGYKHPPFVNYLRRSDGYFYELSCAEMKCSHATGSGAIYKYLFFYGSNGELTPISTTFVYCTPYYEGIDKYWRAGTYNIQSKSGYWIYGGWYNWCGSNQGREDGTLKIKTVGNMMSFDWKFYDAIGHFIGSVM